MFHLWDVAGDGDCYYHGTQLFLDATDREPPRLVGEFRLELARKLWELHPKQLAQNSNFFKLMARATQLVLVPYGISRSLASTKSQVRF